MESGAARGPVRAAGRDIIWIAFLALAYFLAHEWAFLFPDRQKVLAAVWPAGGIGLAALLLSPRRRWPAILLILFLAGIAADLLSGRPLLASVGFMTANVIESLACAWLISRWCGEAVRFDRVKEVLALIVSATAVNACTATLGAGTATLTSASPFWNTWQTWLVGDGLGILLITPLIVTWSDFGDWFRGRRWQRTLEAGLFMVVWCAAGWLAFRPVAAFGALTQQPYMLLALLAWPAFRLGQRGVTLALVVLAAIAVTSKAIGAGPLPGGGADPLESLLAVQAWLGFTAVAGLLLTASSAQDQAAQQSSHESRTRLRSLGDNLPNGMVYQIVRERDGVMRFLYVSTGVKQLTGVSSAEALSDASALNRLFVEEDRPALAAAQQASVRDMTVFEIVARMRRRDGQVRWMHLSSRPRLLPDGRILWDGILLDITGRKREEAAREESEGRFRLVVENEALPVVITSVEDGKVLFVNECAARYFEVSQAEARGLKALDFWGNPAEREQFIKVLSNTGRVAGGEDDTRTRTGQRGWASVSANQVNYGC